MALTNNQGSIIYVNIKKGQLSVRHKDKSVDTFTDISGTIYDVKYKMDSYNDKEFEIAQVFIKDGNENYCLQMRTDSGYFRSLCNSLKSGNINKPVVIKPFMDTKDGKNKTTVFIKQDGVTLKHFHTVNNMGDLPSVKKVVFKGKEEYDGTEQLDYFKNWLISQNWSSQSQPEPKIQRVDEIDEEIIDEDDMPF